MHALADWNSKAGSDPLLYQDRYLYNNNAASLIKQTVIFLYILVDLLVDLSFSGGVHQNPENPPWLRPCDSLTTTAEICNVFLYTDDL